MIACIACGDSSSGTLLSEQSAKELTAVCDELREEEATVLATGCELSVRLQGEDVPRAECAIDVGACVARNQAAGVVCPIDPLLAEDCDLDVETVSTCYRDTVELGTKIADGTCTLPIARKVEVVAVSCKSVDETCPGILRHRSLK